MIVGDGLRAPVLIRREAAGEVAALWAELRARGWLPQASRVVVQLGSARSCAVMATAASLCQALRAEAPHRRIEGGECGQPVEWGRLGIDGPAETAPLTVTGIAAPELAVPAWWFADVAVVTIATPAPCRRLGLALMLDAQAAVLERLGNRLPAAVLAYEAHRLARSDLAVACGRTAAGERWWMASPSDVALELAVARAGGRTPADLPALRAIAQHEQLPAVEVIGGAPPPLAWHAVPPWLLAARTAGERGVATAHGLLRDARTVWRNLNKIPAAVRRRLASRVRSAA